MALSGTFTDSETISNQSSTAIISTTETTTSTTYTDLTTPGPSVTVNITANGMALVVISLLGSNNTIGSNSLADVTISGANTSAAADANGVWNYLSPTANASLETSYIRLVTGLAAGSTTFKLQYRASGNTSSFSRRRLTIVVF